MKMEILADLFPHYLNLKGEKVLDEEVQNKLREIVRCAICFQIPEANNLKVFTCQRGHHFCPSCYKNLKHCGICRGEFFLGRNFVVEELITQLGPSLGLTKENLPPRDEVPNLVRGQYTCLHMCSTKLKAGQLLHHIRGKHKQNLLDNVRSNPYLKRFDWMFIATYCLQSISVFSVHISDMGLFTVIINITDDFLIGSLHSLLDETALSSFQCKLSLRISKSECTHEFSVSNFELHAYNYNVDTIISSRKYLKVETSKLSELLNTGNKFQILFSIWRRREEKENANLTIVLPEEPILFKNDRNKQRNKKRNFRRSKLKHKLRKSENVEQEQLNHMQIKSLHSP